MKSTKKKKFDIKNFFIQHIEKILLALIVPLALYVAYTGTRYELLTWKPEDLQQISTQADTHIRTNDWTADSEDVKITPYEQVAGWIKVGVSPDLYRTTTLWMPSLFPPKNKRPGLEPTQLLTVRDLRASSGLGAVAVNPNSAAAQALDITTPQTGRRWAVITGLIPVKEQLVSYVDAFSSSVHPDPIRDMPLYDFYEIERAEVVPGQSADLEWKKLDFSQTFKINMDLWSGVSLDPVDPTYIAPGAFPIAYPLPPIDKKYGEEVAHTPQIPLLTETQIKQSQQIEQLQKRQLKEFLDVDERDFLERDPFSGVSRQGSAGVIPGIRGGEGANQPRRRRTRDKEDEEIIKPVEVTNYLFRFFDFDVEPGKTYRYRVRLQLANPNYRLPPNVLEEESLAKEPRLMTDFSTASNMVTIPLESRVLVTKVASPKTNWQDPTAGIMAVHFNIEDGSEWCVEKDKITRGSTINFSQQDGKNFALSGKEKERMPEPVVEEPTRRSTGRNTRQTRAEREREREKERKAASVKPQPEDDGSKRKIDILSDVCVMDLIGGNTLLKSQQGPVLDFTSPGRMLVLEPSGNMVIRKVNTDLTEIETIKTPLSTSRSGGRFGMRN